MLHLDPIYEYQMQHELDHGGVPLRCHEHLHDILDNTDFALDLVWVIAHIGLTCFSDSSDAKN